MPKRAKVPARILERKFDATAFRLSQERNDFLLPQILDFVTSRRWVNLRPEYQRRLVWSQQKQSQFIESLLMNIPIPQIFLYESDLSRYEVMDGQQRLNAVVGFYENTLELRGLEKWKEINGQRYRDLPEKLQRGLDRRRLSATILLLETGHESEKDVGDIRRLVFERLNTGGQQLNAQELRNCLYAGHFNDMLIEVARTREFAELWGIPPYEDNVDAAGTLSSTLARNRYYSRMLDCEIALRFFAFRDVASLRSSVRKMLDRCMEARVDLPKADVERLRRDFMQRLELARKIFGEHTFQHQDANGRWKTSQPLFDGLMVAIDQLWSRREKLVSKGSRIQHAVTALLTSEDAYNVIIGKPNTARAISARINLLRQTMAKVAK